MLAIAPVLDHPAPSTIDRLAHEYSLRDELDEEWALRPLGLVHEGGRTILLLAEQEGEPLNRLLRGRPMPIGAFLPLAVRIAAALGSLHRRGLIHKSIRPSHIIVDEAHEAVRFTGFGVASRVSREHPDLEPLEPVAGALAYIAPEQTGRMNRSVDSRSDLYALGVTFYEMLVGSPPFVADDPMEWVHCHIARRPTPPSERVADLPEAVSQIVMKLLAKTAEDRYQTAAGLVADLEHSLAQWRMTGEVASFALGVHDLPTELRIPEKLYGRERDVETLLDAFERVASNGRAEIVLVSGDPGVGKSSVVNELHKAVIPHRGRIAAGKFDQYQRDIPYATIAQAFRGVIRQILSQSDAAISRWRDAILEAIAPNGQLVTDLIPELELVIGKQPECSRLGPDQSEHRFQLVWRRFIGVFGRAEHPLVLFLDDLQWLDAATLKLLAHLVPHPEVRHVLFVGAYRDHEVGPAHPLRAALDAVKRAPGAVREIRLKPLSEQDVLHLLSDTFNGSDRAAPLARLLHRKTSGNPFFVIQFLTALWDEGLLRFARSENAWTWDIERIKAKGYTDNVVDLMIDKLRRLPKRTQTALKSFACLGNTAEAATLALAQAVEMDAAHAMLWDAVREGLVYRRGGAYHFLHDRIQEAAYALIPEALRAEAHLEIGRRLSSGLSREALHERAFEIVNQFNRGSSLITSSEERDQISELNLIAGKRAKQATAYASALGYLTAGGTLLAKDGWSRNYALTFALELSRAECEFLTKAFDDALARLSDLWRRSATLPDLAAVTCLQLALHTTMDRSDLAVEACLRYLKGVGTFWPAHPSDDEVSKEYGLMWERIGGRPIASLVGLPDMRAPDWRATMDVLTELIAPAVFTDKNLHALVVGRMVNLSLEHGNTDGSCFGYVWAGAVLGARFGDYAAAFQFGRLGVDLVEVDGLDRFKARVYLSFSQLIIPWTRHLRDALPIARRGADVADERGDLTFATYGRYGVITLLLASGEPLAPLEDEIERAVIYARDARFGLVADIIRTQFALVRTLRGRSPIFGCFDDDEFSEALTEERFAQDRGLAWAECIYWVRKLQARLLAGDYESALHAAPRAETLLWTAPSFFENAEFHFYAALAHAGAWKSASETDRPQHLDALSAHMVQLATWAENCPENFEDRSSLVAAEIARLEKRELDAQRLYERAIDAAHRNGFIQNEALASEIAAEFYLDHGLETSALAHLQNARACYAQWGADGKVRQLDRRHPRLAAIDFNTPVANIGSLAGQLDFGAVMKASQAISGQIELAKLIETLTTIAMQIGGADRGLLILPRDRSYEVVAEGRASADRVAVAKKSPAVEQAPLPGSLLRYVMRSGEHVLLDDSSRLHAYQDDPYFRGEQARSVLCLPLVQQARVAGILYLENTLTAHAFTPDRIELLKVLAAQAVISLENARLYSDLQEREAKIRRLFESNIIGIFQWDAEGNVAAANDAALDLLGYTRQDLEAGKIRLSDMTPPEHRASDERAVESLQLTGSCAPYEKEFFRKDGGRAPVLVGAARFEGVRDEGVSFVLDLTESKQAALRQKTLIDELNHRVKNTLATVQSICSQTLRTAESPAVFQEEFSARLQALSQTHNVLNKSGWQGANLRKILEEILVPFTHADGAQFEISGKEVKLGPTSAVTMGMAFHELATNAVKYGALSTPSGIVRVSWEVRDQRRLHILWEERGGPAVQPPRRQGFGQRLIERNLPVQLDGQVRLDFEPEGVRCEMDASLSVISRI